MRKVVRQSRMLGRVAHVRSPLLAVIRDAMLRAMTRGGDTGGQSSDLFGWAPP
ncbi:hypothetical protein ACFSTC_20790 [Nonomuraea ferruginea]